MSVRLLLFIILLPAVAFGQQPTSPLAPSSIAVETQTPTLVGLADHPPASGARVAASSSGRGAFFHNWNRWDLALAVMAGGAQVGDGLTTWDATRRDHFLEGNPLLSDQVGHPRFGIIFGSKLTLYGTAFVLHKRYPTLSRGLFWGLLIGGAYAVVHNTTVARGAK